MVNPSELCSLITSKVAELTFDRKLDDEAPRCCGVRAIFERRSKYQLQFL
jgi:hypothetical protein